MEAGASGIERFTPEIIVNSMYIGEDSIRHSRFFGVLMTHSETLKRSVQDFVPSSKIEVEGKRTTLRLFSVLPLKEGAAFNSLCAEVRQKIHWIEHGVNF